jgi:hypothetical protein
MAGLDRFLDKTRHYFEWFMRELGGQSMTPLAIKQRLENAGATAHR